MAGLPSGTVTFLFTDIEGSTQRWEHHRAGMARALDAHNARLRTAMAVHGGYVFKTMGDAFCVAFADPAAALAAALDAARAIAAEDRTVIGGDGAWPIPGFRRNCATGCATRCPRGASCVTAGGIG